MERCDIYNMFYNQDQVCYGKGFKLFEDIYEELKDELDLIKEDKGDYVVVRPRKTKVQKVMEMLDEATGKRRNNE